MRQFFFTYLGHKWNEAKELYKYCEMNEITTIIEPFCGGCGFSLYGIFKNNNDKDIKYIFNDKDTNLINFLKEIKKGKLHEFVKYYNDNIGKYYNNLTEWHNLRKKKDKSIFEWYLSKRACGRDAMLYKYDKKNVQISTIKLEDFAELERIFMSDKIELTNFDYNEIIEKYKDDPHVLIYLDPPYFDSFNSIYDGYNKIGVDEKRQVIDNTKMYIDILNFIKTSKCKIILSINDNAIIRHLFGEYVVHSTDKTYQVTKKKTKHLIVTKMHNEKKEEKKAGKIKIKKI